MKNSKKYKLVIILTMVMLVAPLAVISIGGGGSENSGVSLSDGASTSSTNFTGYTPISTPSDLAKIGTQDTYPLSGRYYLTNDIDFAGTDMNGGKNINMSAMVSGTSLRVTLMPSSGSVTSLYAWFGTSNTKSTNNTITFSGIPTGANTLSIGGTLSTGDNFAYSTPINTAASSINTTFNSNGNFTPIGTGSASFTGIFNGNGYAITGLNTAVYNSSINDVYAGLFGYVANSATISNLGVIGGSATALSSSLSGSYSGGIIGSCFSFLSTVTVSNCYNTGSVTASSLLNEAIAGGIIGDSLSELTISNCYNIGSVTASTSLNGADAGGITGSTFLQSSIQKCYNTGRVTALSSLGDAEAGGIDGVTFLSSSIMNCYNTGSVTASSASSWASVYAGGIIGNVDVSSLTVSNCYSTGSTATSYSSSQYTHAYAGGIAGNAGLSSLTISNCYYLMGHIYKNGANMPDIICGGDKYTISNGGSQRSGPYSASQMAPTLQNAQNGSSIYYSGGGGWDFKNTWTISADMNDGYPTLRAASDPNNGFDLGPYVLALIIIAVIAVAVIALVLILYKGGKI